MQPFSMRWRVTPKEAQNTPIKGVENGDHYG
jgi:hypothetical protein